MLISRLTKTAAGFGTLALMSSTAYAGCGNSLYCNSNSQDHGVAAYESSSHSTTYGGVTLPGGHRSVATTEYGGVTLPGGHRSVASQSYAASTYGTGSISAAYEDSSASYVPFSSPGSTFTTSSVSGYSVPGLGANERLCPTTCGDSVNVHNPGKARVLGCYKVCKPAVVQNYVRVVRPIIYVRYPVVTHNHCPIRVTKHYSRYGGLSQGCGW